MVLSPFPPSSSEKKRPSWPPPILEQKKAAPLPPLLSPHSRSPRPTRILKTLIPDGHNGRKRTIRGPAF